MDFRLFASIYVVQITCSHEPFLTDVSFMSLLTCMYQHACLESHRLSEVVATDVMYPFLILETPSPNDSTCVSGDSQHE